LIAAFVGIVGVAAVLVLLNVATNMSLIADAKLAELKIEPRRGLLTKWLAAFAIAAVAVTTLVLGGTYLSKERYLGVVRGQADEVLQSNKGLLDEVSRLLASGKPEDYKRISEICAFLQNQRSGLPRLTLVYSNKFEDKSALYRFTEYSYYETQPTTYNPQYFSCTKNLDCEYLTRFFSGQKTESLQKYSFRDDQFHIYIPYTGGERNFVVLFDSRNSYGKLGS
jgi:hypothetical protein